MAPTGKIWIWMNVCFIFILSTDVFRQGVESKRQRHNDAQGNSYKYIYLHEKPMDYQGAKEACKKQHCTLPFASSVDDYADLITFIQTKSLQYTVWLSLKQQVFSKWMWVSDSQYEELPPFKRRMECGFIDYTALKLRKTTCSALWLGYICQTQQSACQSFRAGTKQLKIGQKCFRVNFEKVNWYEARWRCRRENMDLAVIQNRYEETQLKNALSNTWTIFNFWQFWIGFYNADWYLKNGVKDSITNHIVFWDWGQPSHHGSCAVVERRNHLWRSANCSERHHVVCQRKQTTTTELKLTTQTTDPSVPARTAKASGEHRGNQATRLKPGGSAVWFCFWMTVLLSEHIGRWKHQSLTTGAKHEDCVVGLLVLGHKERFGDDWTENETR